jgi:hypothetical protein
VLEKGTPALQQATREKAAGVIEVAICTSV